MELNIDVDILDDKLETLSDTKEQKGTLVRLKITGRQHDNIKPSTKYDTGEANYKNEGKPCISSF